LRILAVKLFARFQKQERISDAALCEAIARACNGLIDADLGHGLIKQRVARSGQGRSGGYRTLIAYRVGDRAVFLYGFAKSDRGNIGKTELALFRSTAQGIQKLTDDAIAARLADGDMVEVDCGNQDAG
jgi:hypothetical protein